MPASTLPVLEHVQEEGLEDQGLPCNPLAHDKTARTGLIAPGMQPEKPRSMCN